MDVITWWSFFLKSSARWFVWKMVVAAVPEDSKEVTSPVPTSKGRNSYHLYLVCNRSGALSSSYWLTWGIILTRVQNLGRVLSIQVIIFSLHQRQKGGCVQVKRIRIMILLPEHRSTPWISWWERQRGKVGIWSKLGYQEDLDGCHLSWQVLLQSICVYCYK